MMLTYDDANLFFSRLYTFNLLDLYKRKISKKVYDSLQEEGILYFREKSHSSDSDF